MSSSLPSRQAVLGLFRGLLRAAGHMEDYNFRAYAQRRVILGFRENRALSGEALAAEYKDGLQHLEMLKRCVGVGCRWDWRGLVFGVWFVCKVSLSRARAAFRFL
jgi:hypothetical protein